MITLLQTPPAWGLSTFSPFCLKVETYLRMAELPYQAKAADIRKAPKGKVPWIEDDGHVVADSSQIIAYLKEKHGDPLDRKLSASQRARALLLQRTIEEHTYFALAALRWFSDAAWPHLREAFAPMLPRLIAPMIMKSIRKSVRKSLHGQGMGRHGRDEIVELARRDLEALSITLGDEPFFLGDRPTSIDAVVYGFLAQILFVPWDSEEKAILRESPNLVEFCERMRERYWKDHIAEPNGNG